MKGRNILLPGPRKAKAYIPFTEVNQMSWCPQSQTGLLCPAVALGSVHTVCTQCAYLAFLSLMLLTELVVFKEFSMLSVGSCVYGSKTHPVDSLVI